MFLLLALACLCCRWYELVAVASVYLVACFGAPRLTKATAVNWKRWICHLKTNYGILDRRLKTNYRSTEMLSIENKIMNCKFVNWNKLLRSTDWIYQLKINYEMNVMLSVENIHAMCIRIDQGKCLKLKANYILAYCQLLTRVVNPQQCDMLYSYIQIFENR